LPEIPESAPYRELALALDDIRVDRRLSNVSELEKLLAPLAKKAGRRPLKFASTGNRPPSQDDLREILASRTLSQAELHRLQLGLMIGDRREQKERALPSLPALDVIGISAINTDHILPASSKRISGEDLGTEDVTWNELDIQKRLEDGHVDSLVSRLGGSAVNCVRTLNVLGLRTGLVAVAGTPPTSISDADRRRLEAELQLLAAEVDGSFVRGSENVTGRCVSEVVAKDSHAERFLLTWPGANLEIWDLIHDKFEELVRYLARARVVHISALIDLEGSDALANLLAELVEAVREASPHTTISCDPGYVWSHAYSLGASRILKLCDLAFCDQEELALLARTYGGAEHLLPHSEQYLPHAHSALRSSDAVLVVRLRRSVTLYAQSESVEVQLKRSGPSADGTGAGDVFAGGFLAARLDNGLDDRDGAALGMRLARHKVSRPDLGDPEEIRAIASEARKGVREHSSRSGHRANRESQHPTLFELPPPDPITDVAL